MTGKKREERGEEQDQNAPAAMESGETAGARSAGRVVVITGGGGFIGRSLLAALAEKGYRLRVLARTDRNDEFFKSLGAQIVRGDMRDKNVPDMLLEGASGVFHLAGIIGRVGIVDSEYWDVHVNATRNLLKAATKHGVSRFLHCSTTGILATPKDEPADEDTPCLTNDIYRVTKTRGEVTALASDGKKGLRVTVVRPSLVYGPGDMRLLWIFKKVISGKFRMIGSGNALVHPIFIDDMVKGMMLAYEAPKAAGRVYILAGPKYVTLAEWVRIIAREAGVEPPEGTLPYYPIKAAAFLSEKFFTFFGLEPPIFRRRVDFFLKNRAYKIDRARAELGFEPSVGLAEGAKRTLAWYREKGLI